MTIDEALNKAVNEVESLLDSPISEETRQALDKKIVAEPLTSSPGRPFQEKQEFQLNSFRNIIDKKGSIPPYIFQNDKTGEISISKYQFFGYVLHKFPVVSTDEHFAVYMADKGIWNTNASRMLEKYIESHTLELWSESLSRSTINRIRQKTYNPVKQSDIFNKNAFAITVNNGTIYLTKDGVMQFKEEWNLNDMSTVKIPHAYNPGATFPTFTYEFLTAVLDNPEIDFLFEWLGYCLIKGYPMQHFMFILGSGGNGKSTIIRLLTAVLGQDNVSGMSLKNLDGDTGRFAKAQLFNRLANFQADIDGDHYKDSSIIKTLTGDDIVFAEHKGQDGFSFMNFAKMMFSCNELPTFEDKTHGFLRRPLILPMTKQPNNGRDISEITNDKDEMERILNHAINSICGVLSNGKQFTTTEAMDDAKSNWLGSSKSPVEQFIDEKCIVEPGATMKRSALYPAYKEYCNDSGYKSLGKQKFNNEILKIPGITERENKGWNFDGIMLAIDKKMDELENLFPGVDVTK